MSRWNLTLLLAAAGCGATWGFGGEADDVLYTQCAEPKTYYLDVDGDGWGDPQQVGLEDSCEPDANNFYTATNARDCDDENDDVTGLVGSLCPSQLVYSASNINYVGLVAGGNEFVYLHGDPSATPFVDVRDAESRCAQWGATELIDGVWTSTGGLATFGLGDTALDDLQLSLEQEGITGDFAAYIGIEWSGGIADGAWTWTDDSDAALIDSIGWCGDAAPLPEDFFPGLNPNDASHAQIIEEALDWIRLALIRYQEIDTDVWCIGLPSDLSDDRDPSQAHLVCERLPPDATDYEVSYVEGADGG